MSNLRAQAPMRWNHLGIPLLVGACLFAVGCSGDGDDTSTPYDPNATPTEPDNTPEPTLEPEPTPTPTTTGIDGTCGSSLILQVTGTAVTEDTLWECKETPYVLTNDISVEGGATLTIGPGVTVQLGSDVSLRVGSEGAGAIVADGREDAIRFTTNKPIGTPGDYEGIIVDALATQAEFRNVTFEYGGDYTSDGSEPGDALLHIYRGSAIVTDCTFQSSSSAGMYLSTGGTVSEFDGNTFLTNIGAPMVLEANSVGSLVGTHTFDANDQIRVEGGQLEADATWVHIGAPYAVDGTLTVGGNDAPVLTVGPGVSLLFEEEAKLLVGAGDPGGLRADGSEGAITFGSAARVPAPGNWEGIIIDREATEAYFKDVAIRHGGNYSTDGSLPSNAGLVVIGADVQLTRSTIESNAVYGMQLLGGASLSEFSENNFALSAQAAIFTGPNEVSSLAGTNTFEASDFIEVSGGNITKSGTWGDVGAPYRILDTIEVSSAETPILTLDADTRLLFDADTALIIGRDGPGGLVADGSAGAITLTSGVLPAAAGDWEGVIIDENAVDNVLREVTIEYAGNYSSSGSNPGEAALRVIGSSAIVTDSTFRENLVYDVDFADGAGTSEFFRNVFESIDTVPVIIDAAQAGGLGTANIFEVGRRVNLRGGTLAESASWSYVGAPFLLLDYLHVGGDAEPVLEIQDDVTVQFESNTGITVGSVGPGALIADGKGGDITFTAAGVEREREAGDWQAVVFDGQADDVVSFLDSVIFEYCGDFADYPEDPEINIEACLGIIDINLNVDDCTFKDSAGAGVKLEGSGAISGEGNTFTNTKGEVVDDDDE